MKINTLLSSSVAIASILFLISSCTTTQNLYSWHDYEDITYQYNKKHTEELKVKVLEEYQNMIQKTKRHPGYSTSRYVCRIRIYAI